MGNVRRTVVVGKFETLRRIVAFCREQLYHAHGPAEGERQFSKLPLLTALEMWRRRTAG